jgi:hypothetical protein
MWLASEGGFQVFHLGTAEHLWLWFPVATALGALGVAALLVRDVLAVETGTPHMPSVADAIRNGAGTYLATVPHDRGDRGAPHRGRLPQLQRGGAPRRVGHAQRHGVRGDPVRGVPARRRAVRADRLRRHELGGSRQRPDGCRGTHRFVARGAACRVPHRWGDGHVHGRHRAARRDADHPHVPEHRVRDPAGVRVRRLAARALPACRWRDLHQGGRRRRGPRGQGRGRHPRGRRPEPGHDRRQRRRQRGRLRRDGRPPVRELRGDPRRLDHPRRRRVPLDRTGSRPRAGLPLAAAIAYSKRRTVSLPAPPSAPEPRTASPTS